MCLVNKQTVVNVQNSNNGFILWHNIAKDVFCANNRLIK